MKKNLNYPVNSTNKSKFDVHVFSQFSDEMVHMIRFDSCNYKY